MSYSKVYWLLDEIIGKTDPKNWEEIKRLSADFISLGGNKRLEHQIVDPIDSFRKLSRNLVGLPIATIVDLSGWIGSGLEPLFPNADLVDNFSVSRVLDVSTRSFKTAGYILNFSKEEILNKAKAYDLSQVLIVDDTAVSGGTCETVMNTWGIPHENVTLGVLFANTGSGHDALNDKDANRVIYGDSMTIPEHDAEHMFDVFHHSNLKEFFPLAAKFHHSVRLGNYGNQVKQLLSDDQIRMLFPEQVVVTDIVKLHNEGKFFAHSSFVPTSDSIYSRNPNLWTFDEFWKKVDEGSVQESRAKVLQIMEALQSFHTDDPEGRLEVRRLLRSEARSTLNREGYSDGFRNSKERLS